MHGKSARTGAAHARAARASEGHGRALLPCAVLLALVALLLAPTRAYADGGGGSHYFGGDGGANYRTVLYSSDYADGVQYIVGADNKYDAAAYICGQTSAQVAAYDLTVRYKLSATENEFAALADRLERVWPGWNEETLGQNLASVFARVVDGTTLWDVMTNILTGTLSHFQIFYWQNNVDCDIYAIDTTSNAVALARDDLQEILNGGGGGGGSSEIADQMTFSLENYPLDANINPAGAYTTFYTYNNGVYYLMFSKGSQTYNYPSGNSLTITGLSKRFDLEQYTRVVVLLRPMGRYGNGVPWQNNFYLAVICASDDLTVNFDDVTQKVTFAATNFNARYWQDIRFGSADFGTLPKHFEIDVTNISGTQVSSATRSWDYGFMFGDNATTPDPEPPSGPGNWPDPPSNPTPEPPTVPDPPQNPEPDPPSTPTAPTPPPLEPPTNVTIPTGTTAADYTPWLRAILEQLQTLTDELASHCVHLQEEMQTSVNELQDTLIYRFNSLESQIWDLFNGLEDYLHDLAAWLAEQLDFNVNVDPYDDNSVLYWLRQIYSRLGNLPKSPTTIMDPDPTEPFDFWAWLMNLIANTVGGIIGDLVGDVAGLLDLFKEKFPFSIPWDIAALLTLLDGTRATPAFDVKIAAVQGWWQETTFRIDLTPFDSVASACRTMVNILWVMVLVMKTDWMLAIMGDATSFGERFARKVARTS